MTTSSSLPSVDRRLAGARVFLAEDDDDLRALFVAALRRHGYEVHAAGDGSEMLGLFSSVALRAVSPPDAIVMDVRMPGHDGTDLLLALRLAEWNVPIVLMTAFGDDRLRQRVSELGATVLLDKPLSTDVLVAAIERATAGSTLPEE